MFANFAVRNVRKLKNGGRWTQRVNSFQDGGEGEDETKLEIGRQSGHVRRLMYITLQKTKLLKGFRNNYLPTGTNTIIASVGVAFF